MSATDDFNERKQPRMLRLIPGSARTIRFRLTLAYGLVFLLTGAALLTSGYFLVRHNLDERLGLRRALRLPPFPDEAQYGNRFLYRYFEQVRQELADTELHRLLVEYIAALVLMTGISVVVGWVLAGRALAPLRKITTTARRVSGENLGERIALEGPQDELKELADTFDGMLSRLDNAFASQRHFVANASHELRTPLAIMRTEVDVALADPDADAGDLRAMGEAVRETIDRSEALIATLLMLARSESVVGRSEPVDLAALTADCITDLHARAESAQIEIHTALEPAIARGEPRLLERLIANLIDNGIRYNEPDGQLRVATATEGAGTRLTVSNTGAVIDPEQAQALTEPFRRLSRVGGGFGLGLSIVRSVAEAHGGAIELTAPPAGGLVVRVTLPADTASTAAAPRRQRSLTKS